MKYLIDLPPPPQTKNPDKSNSFQYEFNQNQLIPYYCIIK